MTATEMILGTYADCLDCNGSGVRPTGLVEVETGHHQTVPCSMCGGDGTVDAEWVRTCEGCSESFWAGDGCDHHGIHCDACKPANCTDCRDEARHV